jgi:hypothetical protein
MKTLFPTAALAAIAGVMVMAVGVRAAEQIEPKAVSTKKSSAAAKAKTAAVEESSTATANPKPVRVAAVWYGGGGAAANATASGPLPEAYHLLKSADHDYKGHRARAMHQIEAAARLLGMRIAGGGKGHEAQGTSDSQLRSAQSLLNQAAGNLAGQPLLHIQEAIRQLSIALSIR